MNEPTRQPLGPLLVDIAGPALTAADRALLRRPAVGGVILFARNYESPRQLRALTADLKALRDPPLLVAADQEGGRVQRFRDGFCRLPAAREIGRAYDRDPQQGLALARDAGELMAGELLAAGVDLSFAPVLDLGPDMALNLGPDGGGVIGDRAFHAAPGQVSALAGAVIAGMNAAGMAAVGKHFPGHGGVTADSHHCLPVDNRGMAEFMAADLAPYRDLASRLGGVMTAHLRCPATTWPCRPSPITGCTPSCVKNSVSTAPCSATT